MLLPAIAVVGIGLRLRQFLSGRSLWLDEVFLAENFADVGFPEILTEPLRNNQSAPPGFLAVVYAVVRVLGTTDPALRMVPLIAGILTVLLAVVVAHRLLRSLLAQAAFVTLIALSPALTYYSTEVKQYSLEVLAVMAVLALWSIRRSSRAPWWIGLGGFLIAVLTLTGIIALMALALAIATEQLTSSRSGQDGRRGNRIRYLVSTWWPTGALWAPAFVLHGLYSLHSGVDRTFMVEWWGSRGAFPPPLDSPLESLGWYPSWLMRLAWVGLGEWGPVLPTADTGPLVIGLLIAGLVLTALWGSRDLRLLLGYAFGVVLVLSVLQLYPTSGRLSLYTVPFVFLAVATGLDVALLRGSRVSRVIATTAVAALVAVQLSVTVPFVLQPADDRDGRWVASQALNQSEPGDAFVFEGFGYNAQWYLRDEDLGSVTLYRISFDEATNRATDSIDLSAHPRVWVLSNHRVERASRLTEELSASAGLRLICTASPSFQTFLALLTTGDAADSVDASTACGT